ncbi:MAG TPA: 5'-3' exonuclease H3TH domain-containing protein [Solirubrobacteraceae bacterium]|nr:5'-3' exonuclease H3TH domain-containing protein [Solirubrobacteraceae bacterium]
MTAPLLVVDAPFLLYRSFFALPDSIRGTDERPVNALLGSVNIMLRVVAAKPPRGVVMCFGPDAAPYRTELYPGYHAARPPVPDDLAHQFARAGELFAAFGWGFASDDALEADDLLGSYAAAERTARGRTLILTGDRDMYQCATDDTHVLFLKSGVKDFEEVDPGEVRRRYGVGPELVPDFIALRGDPSDGLPGAPGIGAKTAADLLDRHGSLDGAIDRAIHERPRVTAALTEHAEELRAFREIATLRIKSVKRPADRETDLAGGAAAARGFGMRQLAERLEAAGTVSAL